MANYEPWYTSQTYPALDIPLTRDSTVNGTSSTAVGAPGSTTITCSAGFITTVTTSASIVVDNGTGQQETVTPSSVNVSANQFTATFAKTHSGTYTLIAYPEDITSVLISTFSLIFRSTTGVDTAGTGTFTVKTLIPAEVYYKLSIADAAAAFNGTLIVKAGFPPSNGAADEVVYDPIPFTITQV